MIFGVPQRSTTVVALLGTQALSSDLTEIKNFLDANSNEVVTLILECYVSADDIEAELINARFDALCVHPCRWCCLAHIARND